MLNVALALVPTGDDDGQAVFSAQPVTGPAYFVIATLIGMVVLMVGEADRIEDQMIMNISDEDIADDNAYVYIDKELARASKRAIEMLGQKDIYHVFTPLFPNTSTRIILKKPKTDSSIRKVWLPKTLAYILREFRI